MASDQRRELILIEALRQHPQLYGEGNLWALADSLLGLFDELSRNRIELPQQADEFLHRLARGYGLDGLHPALQREAELVHTLWHAWHSELHERGLLDRHSRHLLQLHNSLQQPLSHPCYLLLPEQLGTAERQWLARLRLDPILTLFIHGQGDDDPSDARTYHPQGPLRQLLAALALPPPTPPQGRYSQALDTIFNPDARHAAPLAERARAFARECNENPFHERLTLFAAKGNEEEAQAISLQLRRWLLEGRQRIGIVTENRKLARRVRALLERAGIQLQDAAGWALSTTSAAAVLERWLQCVEEDFPYVAMLDLLKSPFAFGDSERELHLNTVYHLQHDLIEHEQIGSGLARYRQQLQLRRRRLPQELAEALQGVDDLLAQLAEAAAPLQTLLDSGPWPATRGIEALQQSLGRLGLDQSLGADAAGQRLLDELQQLHQAAAEESTQMDWLAFRSWLGRTWERFHFQPPTIGLGVALMGLGQTSLAHFDGLIIAALEREFLPGASANSPFFNDAVRRELNLPGADELLAQRFAHFRRLLEAAPRVLLSYRQHEGDEEIAPSPWLEALRAFIHLAWGQNCEDRELAALLQQPASQVVMTSDKRPTQVEMPRPSLPGALLPTRYSASAYQQLLNCPYQFFAARGLRLAPPETIREALEKSDYGERVHRCLQAFHRPLDGLPGPFTGPLDGKRREVAIELLIRISEQVFAADLEDNFLHRAWLQRWLARVPDYIDWQIERATQWQVEEVEQQREYPLNGRVTLHGRLDRIDSNGEQLAIIDYKTGNTPKREEVESGEAIQLPFYALLSQAAPRPVAEVSYLGLDKTVSQPLRLADEELLQLSQAIANRLQELDQAMLAGAALPAWGDEQQCEYCQMGGLCRRQMWR